MKSWIRQHLIGAYLAILYPVSCLFNVPALLGRTGLGVLPVDIPWEPGVLAMSVLGLTGLAFAVTGIADGRRGVRELARHFYRAALGGVDKGGKAESADFTAASPPAVVRARLQAKLAALSAVP